MISKSFPLSPIKQQIKFEINFKATFCSCSPLIESSSFDTYRVLKIPELYNGNFSVPFPSKKLPVERFPLHVLALI